MSRRKKLEATKEEKVKLVGAIPEAVLRIFLRFAKSQIENRVKDPYLDKGIALVFPVSSEILDAITDDNAENAEQVKEILRVWTNGPMADYLFELLTYFVSKIEDEHIEYFAGFIADSVVEMIKIATDEVKDKEQLNEWFDEKLRSQETSDLLKFHILVPIMDKAKATEEFKLFVLEVIDAIWKRLLKMEAAKLQKKAGEIQWIQAEEA